LFIFLQIDEELWNVENTPLLKVLFWIIASTQKYRPNVNIKKFYELEFGVEWMRRLMNLPIIICPLFSK
jgi:hypothetical protein